MTKLDEFFSSPFFGLPAPPSRNYYSFFSHCLFTQHVLCNLLSYIGTTLITCVYNSIWIYHATETIWRYTAYIIYHTRLHPRATFTASNVNGTILINIWQWAATPLIFQLILHAIIIIIFEMMSRFQRKVWDNNDVFSSYENYNILISIIFDFNHNIFQENSWNAV